MNVLYIHTHDSGRYFEPYGYHVPTPNLLNLAKEGTLFRHAYCAGPTCSPSRAGLLTGMCAHSSGMLGLAHLGHKLNDYEQHLANFLKRNGYETVLTGIQHEASRSEDIGYDKIYLGMDDKKEEGGIKNKKEFDFSNAQLVCSYIKEKANNKQKPFFLSYGLVNTHREYPQMDQAEQKQVNPNYVMPPYPMYDNEKNRQDMADHINSVKIVDDCVGMVLETLKQSGLEKDTIILFTTDHGIAFPMMKCNLYDSGIGVALIIKYPENKMRGRAIDALVSQIDLFPTLCDLLALDKPAWLQGVSLLPLLENETDSVRNEIFSEVTYHAEYEPMRCIRTKRYKLIKIYNQEKGYIEANMDGGISKDFYKNAGHFDRMRAKEELFDLYLDPIERVNLIDNHQYKEIYTELNKKLIYWMDKTNDPLANKLKNQTVGFSSDITEELKN